MEAALTPSLTSRTSCPCNGSLCSTTCYLLSIVKCRGRSHSSSKWRMKQSKVWTQPICILSQVARILDPIGFASAFLIRAKIGLQELWRQGFEWDEDFSSTVQQKWITFFRELKELNKVSFHLPAEHRPTLCIFADLSQEAFGACAYIRWMTANEKYDAQSKASHFGRPWEQGNIIIGAARLFSKQEQVFMTCRSSRLLFFRKSKLRSNV